MTPEIDEGLKEFGSLTTVCIIADYCVHYFWMLYTHQCRLLCESFLNTMHISADYFVNQYILKISFSTVCISGSCTLCCQLSASMHQFVWNRGQGLSDQPESFVHQSLWKRRGTFPLTRQIVAKMSDRSMKDLENKDLLKPHHLCSCRKRPIP